MKQAWCLYPVYTDRAAWDFNGTQQTTPHQPVKTDYKWQLIPATAHLGI